jgi:periplasmic copper chaperone A
MKRVVLVSMFLLVLALSACAPSAAATEPKISIESAYVTAVMSSGGMQGMGGNGAAFMLIKNGGAADKLLKVESDAAKSVELHQTKMENNVMSMQPVTAIDVPANGQVELKSGSYHVMMMDLTRELKESDKIKLTLVFEKAGSISVDAEVRKP